MATRKALAIEMFRRLGQGEGTYRLAEEGVAPLRTLQRFNTAKVGFEEGKSDEELAKTTKWLAKRVALIRGWHSEQLRGTKKSAKGLDAHHRSLRRTARRLRDQVVNPHLEDQPNTGDSIWDWAGKDWRLEPRTWFHMMTPDLPDPAWQKEIKSLKPHLSKSEFWSNFDELQATAVSLDAEIGNAAKMLGEKQPEFVEVWREFKASLSWETAPAKIPGEKLEAKDIKPLTYDGVDPKKVAKSLETFIPGFRQKFRDMEVMLQELWDDLDPDRVGLMIENTTCEMCSPNA